jgi:23S rRNA (pseudouridine1915-N3)-methyltransferase
VVGKTADSGLAGMIAEYEKRLTHYVKFEQKIIKAPKNAAKLSTEQLKIEEGKLILVECSNSDQVILLDEVGKEFSSERFAHFLQAKMNSGLKDLVFVIGGAFGFSDSIYQRANSKMTLSQMTFTHQMVRLVFVEQLYRAFTIIRNEGYHH